MSLCRCAATSSISSPNPSTAAPSSARPQSIVALTILSHNEPSELSLQQHLDLAPDLSAYTNLAAEGEPEPSMMAQPVPHQPTDKKRVKVYELRNNDWFDRGTGFCTASFATVCHGLRADNLNTPFLRFQKYQEYRLTYYLIFRPKMAEKTPGSLSNPKTSLSACF